MAWVLLERADSRYPGGVGVSFENGRSSASYILQIETIDDVNDALTYILGGVQIDGGGRLTRTLPKANPFLPHHFATRITSLTGIGKNSVAETTYDFAAEPLALSYALYSTPRGFYDIRIDFEPRMYQVLPDDDIEPTLLTWIDTDGSGVADTDSREHYRYVVPIYDPAPTLAYAQTGQLAFYTGGGGVPNSQTLSNFPFTILPDGKFTLTWYQVPVSIVDDPTHPMHKFVGRINQKEFFNRPPGSLLYMGPKVLRRYLPPVPNIDVAASGITFRQEFLCDILFDFNYTARTVTDPPSFANGNWITDGWNTQVRFFDGKFYYVGINTETAQDRRPLYLSAPMELLFQCPTEE